MSRCIVVSGLPCSGKSTLAAVLARRYACPLLSKDRYKEQIFDREGIRDRAWSRSVSTLAWGLLLGEAERLIAGGYSCVLEGNFREPQAKAVRKLAASSPVRFIEVQCVASPGVLLQRYRARAVDGSRHPGHVDLEALPGLEAELGLPPADVLADAGSRIVCDTSAGVDAERTVREVALLFDRSVATD